MMSRTYSVWKPVDMMSGEVVRMAKKAVSGNLKVGHAGTLDPFAEGILVLCFGDKTKDVSKIMAMKKEYIGVVKLGVETDTLDRTGLVYKKNDIPELDLGRIKEVLDSFVGDVKQVPPSFSALKLNGRCLYEYARQGIRIIKKPRTVKIHALDLIEYNGLDSIKFKVCCGSGTYIRSLASDIARALGTYGYLDSLKRVRIGCYDEKNSITVNELLDGSIK